MATSAERLTLQLAAARAGSQEDLGQLLETCRGYLLLVAQQELAPDIRRKESPSDLVQQTFLERSGISLSFRGIRRPSYLPGCGAPC